MTTKFLCTAIAVSVPRRADAGVDIKEMIVGWNQDPGGQWSARLIDLPEAVAHGQTQKETIERLREVAEKILAGLEST